MTSVSENSSSVAPASRCCAGKALMAALVKRNLVCIDTSDDGLDHGINICFKEDSMRVWGG